jgi:hypothetical protein
VTSVTSFDRKNSNVGYDLINNPYVSIYENVLNYYVWALSKHATGWDSYEVKRCAV